MTDHKHESVGVFSRGPCDAPRVSICACGATQKVGSGTWTVPPNPRSFDVLPPEQRAELLAFSEWLKLPKPRVTFEVYRAEHLPPPSETKLSEAIEELIIASDTMASTPSHAQTERIKAARSSLESLYREQIGEVEHFRRVIEDQNKTLVRNSNELSALRSLQPRPLQTSVQWEPPYPDHETAIVSIRYPYHTAHKPTQLCAIQEPHLIEDCGEFER